MNMLRSAFGNYAPVGNANEADIISGHSFGTVVEKGSVNYALAQFILETSQGRPITADRMLVDAFPRGEKDVDLVIEGPVSNTTGQGVGSWGTLVETKEFMESIGLDKPMIVAQAHHVGRVAMQARKLGLTPIVPVGLPTHFDANSEQRWTRSAGWWIPREVLGSLVLKKQGRL